MKIFVERTNERKEIDFEGTVGQLLSRLQINPETVIVSKGNELMVGSDKLSNDSYVKIHSIISGG
jgi:sulfur carrier protein